jgi:hypothetical protein
MLALYTHSRTGPSHIGSDGVSAAAGLPHAFIIVSKYCHWRSPSRSGRGCTAPAARSRCNGRSGTFQTQLHSLDTSRPGLVVRAATSPCGWPSQLAGLAYALPLPLVVLASHEGARQRDARLELRLVPPLRIQLRLLPRRGSLVPRQQLGVAIDVRHVPAAISFIDLRLPGAAKVLHEVAQRGPHRRVHVHVMSVVNVVIVHLVRVDTPRAKLA